MFFSVVFIQIRIQCCVTSKMQKGAVANEKSHLWQLILNLFFLFFQKLQHKMLKKAQVKLEGRQFCLSPFLEFLVLMWLSNYFFEQRLVKTVANFSVVQFLYVKSYCNEKKLSF